VRFLVFNIKEVVMSLFHLANEGRFLDQDNRLLSQMREAKEAAQTQFPEDSSRDAMSVSFSSRMGSRMIDGLIADSQADINRTERAIREDLAWEDEASREPYYYDAP
jgi:hypothetical protein